MGVTSEQHEADAMDARHLAWKDTLSDEHLEMVTRTDGMPPEMAMQFMWVDLDVKIKSIQQPLWRRVGATLGVAIGGAVAYLAGSGGPRFGS